MTPALILGIALSLSNARAADRTAPPDIGQLFLVGVRGEEFAAGGEMSALICDENVGGFILYDKDAETGGVRNIRSKPQTTRLIRALQDAAARCGRPPLLIAVDAEGGAVNRLSRQAGFPSYPGAAELGASSDTEKTYRTGLALGEALAEIGVNWDLAPVVELNANTGNPALDGLGRSYSADPGAVTAHARAFIKGLHERAVLAALKHFPGYGPSPHDPHLHPVSVSTAAGIGPALYPYRALIEGHEADSVMTAHVIDPRLDPWLPATLSSAVLSGLLRGVLGYDGVIVSDDMQMPAITRNYRLHDACIAALAAGVDMLLIGNNGGGYDPDAVRKMKASIIHAAASGRVDPARLREALARVRHLKTMLRKENR